MSEFAKEYYNTYKEMKAKWHEYKIVYERYKGWNERDKANGTYIMAKKFDFKKDIQLHHTFLKYYEELDKENFINHSISSKYMFEKYDEIYQWFMLVAGSIGKEEPEMIF